MNLHTHKMKFGSIAKRRLSGLPSHAAQSVPPLRSPLFSRPRRKRRRRFLLALAVVLLIPVLAAGLLKSGLFAPIIEREAIASLGSVLPDTLTADIGEASVGVSGLDGIGVVLDKFALTDRMTGDEILRVDRTRIGVKTVSALQGEPQIRNLKLKGVEIRMPEQAGQAAGLPTIASIEPSLARLFTAINRLFDATTINGLPVNIEIADLRLTGADRRDEGIFVSKATVLARPGQRALEADIEMGGQDVQLAAVLNRSSTNTLSVRVRADGVPLPYSRLRTVLSAVEADHLPDAKREPILADIVATARRTPGDTPDTLTFSVEPTDLSLKLDEKDYIHLAGRLTFAWAPERRVVSLIESPFRVGRSSAVLSGGIRDAPPGTAKTDGRSYQFELIANKGLSNPLDSPERPVKFAARTQGILLPADKRVEVSRIEINSVEGHAEGAGTLDFATTVPNAVFAISIDDFALAGVKQFWPAPVARAARRWVLANLAGGARPRRPVPDRRTAEAADTRFGRTAAWRYGAFAPGGRRPLRCRRRHSAGPRCCRPRRV